MSRGLDNSALGGLLSRMALPAPITAAAAALRGALQEAGEALGASGAAAEAERRARGDAEKAATHYRRLLTLAETADTQRPEIVQARAFLAR